MLRHKNIGRICCIVLALTILLTMVCMGTETVAQTGHAMGYEDKLFDTAKVHTIDIVMDDWDGFIDTCENEEYAACTVVIDGEKYSNVAIRAKGNTSLSSVAQYGNDRYSFKVEFDHYDDGITYHGLDKLSLNNLIQDATFMKDYITYTTMNKMGVAAPLCSYVYITVNGEDWGLYLAVEGVEESFIERNYGSDGGEMYKPDSMSFGGGRGNGKDFDINDFGEEAGWDFGGMQKTSADDSSESGAFSGFGNMPADFGGQMPEGMGNMGMPGAMGDMPENMGEIPDNFDGMPGNMGNVGNMPAGGDVTEPEGMNESAVPGDMGGMQRGGFGGIGSSDVMLQYIDDDPASYSNIFNNAVTDITDADKSRLIASLKALSEGDTSAVDVDAVIRYFVVHDFVQNDDSYTGSMIHNYYLYEHDGVLSMVPWDYNLAFGGFAGGSAAGQVNSPIDSPVSGDVSQRPMVAWIFGSEEYTSLYHEMYAQLISDVVDSGWLDNEIVRVSELIAPYVERDPTAFFSYDEFTAGIAALRSFCNLRGQSVSGQLAGTIPSTEDGQRTDSSSLVATEELDLSDMGSMNMGGGFSGRFSFTSEDTALPEGVELPEGMELPEGTEIPGGMTIPEGIAMQEGMETPEAAEETELTEKTGAADGPVQTEALEVLETPEQTEEAEAVSGSAGRTGSFGGRSMGGMTQGAASAADEPDNMVLMLACAGVLVIGIIIAAVVKGKNV